MHRGLFNLKGLAVWLVMMLMLTVAGPAGAYTVKNNWVRVGATAGETLATGDIVAIKAADGLAYKADADDATLRPAVGVIGSGGVSGAGVEVVVSGLISGHTGLTPGALAYLSGTAGAVTQAAPVWAQPVGVALSATEVYCNFSNYVDATGLTGLVPSTLAANAPDVAGSVWGITNGVKAEGTTADAHETSELYADPTVGDQTWNHPDLAANTTLAYLGTTLTTNAPEIANSVWGVSNGFKAEGVTADAHATTVSFVDPTGTRAVSVPDASGTVDLVAGASHDYAAGAVDWSLSVTEAQLTYVAATNANGAVNAILPAATAGKIRVVYNNTGQVLTFKVTGGAGGTVATGKYALYIDNGTDVVELYEQP